MSNSNKNLAKKLQIQKIKLNNKFGNYSKI